MEKCQVYVMLIGTAIGRLHLTGSVVARNKIDCVFMFPQPAFDFGSEQGAVRRGKANPRNINNAGFQPFDDAFFMNGSSPIKSISGSSNWLFSFTNCTSREIIIFAKSKFVSLFLIRLIVISTVKITSVSDHQHASASACRAFVSSIHFIIRFLL